MTVNVILTKQCIVKMVVCYFNYRENISETVLLKQNFGKNLTEISYYQ